MGAVRGGDRVAHGRAQLFVLVGEGVHPADRAIEVPLDRPTVIAQFVNTFVNTETVHLVTALAFQRTV